MTKKIRALRVQIVSLGEDLEPIQKRGGRYEIDFDENDAQILTNEQVATLFSKTAYDAALYELNEQRGGN